MKRGSALLVVGPVRPVMVGLLLLVGTLLFSQVIRPTSGADRLSGVASAVLTQADAIEPDSESPAPPEKKAFDPAKVMGSQACIKCHKLERLAWMKTKHFGSLEAKLDPANANVQKYCQALGIDVANVRKDSVCATCHATTQADAAGSVRAISGVSCESCHGPAGGEAGWLNRHAVYGPGGTTADQEDPDHQTARIEHCEKAGMVRAERVYTIARNCLGCHMVGEEKLVAAGHPAGSAGFDLVAWSSGEVRHNFHAEVQAENTKNAEAPRLWMRTTKGTVAGRKRVSFVLGALADLELSLRQRASAKSPAIIAQLGGRIGGLNGKLAQIVGVAPTVTEVPPLQGQIGAAFGRLFAPMPDDEKYYTGIADKVAEAAESFSKSHDGSKLTGLDGLWKATPAKGTPYQP